MTPATTTNNAPDAPRRALPPRNIDTLVALSRWPLEHVEATLETGRGLDKLAKSIKENNPERDEQAILSQIEQARAEFLQTSEAKRNFFKDTWVGRRVVDVKDFAWNNKWKLVGLAAALLGFHYFDRIKSFAGDKIGAGLDKAKPAIKKWLGVPELPSPKVADIPMLPKGAKPEQLDIMPRLVEPSKTFKIDPPTLK